MATSVSSYNRSFATALRLDAATGVALSACALLHAHLCASKINRRPTAWVAVELAAFSNGIGLDGKPLSHRHAGCPSDCAVR